MGFISYGWSKNQLLMIWYKVSVFSVFIYLSNIFELSWLLFEFSIMSSCWSGYFHILIALLNNQVDLSSISCSVHLDKFNKESLI